MGDAIPWLLCAVLYALTALVVVSPVAPHGRWLAVHLFTLGTLTNAILGFSEHFGRVLTRTPGQGRLVDLVVANVGILLTLAGIATGTTAATAAGAVVITGAVVVAYRRLRRMRRTALGARFGWVVRIYERAHGAFVHGAILGLLLGLGLLPGGWYLAGRTAHLHISVLGWAGLTLLATLVFFGPTLARTRIRPGADDQAARALRHGATALTVGVLLLLATGVGGVASVALRVAAAVALAGFALAATTVCVPVLRAALGGPPSATRWPVVAVTAWLPPLVWADVAVVASGAWRWLDVLGVAALVAVLGQAVLATATHVTPLLRARSTGAREAVRARLDRLAGARTVLLNLGAGLVAASVAVRDVPLVGAVGWSAIVLPLGYLVVSAVWPVRRAGVTPPAPAQRVA